MIVLFYFVSIQGYGILSNLSQFNQDTRNQTISIKDSGRPISRRNGRTGKAGNILHERGEIASKLSATAPSGISTSSPGRITLARNAKAPQETMTNRLYSKVLSNSSTLARDLLTILAPHNWIQCQGCGEKATQGLYCISCGRKLEFPGSADFLM